RRRRPWRRPVALLSRQLPPARRAAGPAAGTVEPHCPYGPSSLTRTLRAEATQLPTLQPPSCASCWAKQPICRCEPSPNCSAFHRRLPTLKRRGAAIAVRLGPFVLEHAHRGTVRERR